MDEKKARLPGGDNAGGGTGHPQNIASHQLSQPTTAAEAARCYINNGWCPIPVPHRMKAPSLKRWPDLRLSEKDIPQYFGDPSNIGVLLGDASGNLVDVDLDCDQSIKVADVFLPDTSAVFGRKSGPRSHRLYTCDPLPTLEQFSGPDGNVLVEIRSTSGHLTILPPSTHPSGEQVLWYVAGQPPKVDAGLLRFAVAKTASAALLARHWPSEGSRQNAAIALAGGLLRAGWPKAEIWCFVAALLDAAGDHETLQRLGGVDHTCRKAKSNGQTTGWPTLGGLMGEAVIAKVLEFLSIPGPASGGATSSRPSYQEFPTKALPEPVAGFVTEAAVAIGCDPSLVALPLLSMFAAAIGNTRQIQLKRKWSEPSVLWTLPVARSGELKSPAADVALEPIRKIQRQAMVQHQEVLKDHPIRLKQYEKDLAIWKRTRQESLPPSPPETPVPQRYVVSDTTIEALAVLLQQSPRGLLLARDELSGWLRSFDAYRHGRGGDVAHWLEMHRAGGLIVDRKSGPQPTVYVPRAALCITGSIQPDTLRRCLRKEHFENGLAPRLLLAMPPRRRKRWTDSDITPRAAVLIEGIVSQLLSLSFDVDSSGQDCPRHVPLSPQAHEAWVEFYNEYATEAAAMSDDRLVSAWAKLEGYAARLALVLHYVRWAGSNTVSEPHAIDKKSMVAGITLARWFGNEAKRVYAVLEGSEVDRARWDLVDQVQVLGGQASPRDLMRNGPRYKTADEADAALEDLANAGLGIWVYPSPSSAGGRPSRLFKLYDSNSD